MITRLGRLTDAFDRVIEQDLFEAGKKTLLAERLDLEAHVTKLQDGKRDATEELAKFIERADSAYLVYKGGTVEEKRDLVDSLTSKPHHCWDTSHDHAEFAVPGSRPLCEEFRWWPKTEHTSD